MYTSSIAQHLWVRGWVVGVGRGRGGLPGFFLTKGGGDDSKDPPTKIFGKPTDPQMSNPTRGRAIGRPPTHPPMHPTAIGSPTMAYPTGGGGGAVGSPPAQKF